MDPITGIIGVATSAVGKVIDNFFPSEEDKAKAELLKAQVITELNAGAMQEMNAQVAVIVAEAQSKSWLTASWRPIVMLIFAAIVGNNYILYPYLSAIWHGAPLLPIPPDLWDLLKLGIGGYVFGRSAEKVASTLANGKKGE